jgi:diguanylate cyclase (GGDEF)-like protein
MRFVPSTLLILFAGAFFAVWMFMGRSRRYLLTIGAGFLFFGVGILYHLTFWTLNVSYKPLISATLFSSAALSLSSGILSRSHIRRPLYITALWFIAILCSVAYFSLVEPDLIARSYIINFGLGGIFLQMMWYVRSLRHGEAIDRALFWLLFFATAQFFLRTILTIHSITDSVTTSTFGRSTYWIWIQISSSVIGASLAFGLLTVIASDIIMNLRRERDSDVLTGLLNRRGLGNKIPTILAKSQNSDVSIVVCDVDFFKRINDTYGHATGDAVLRNTANVIASAIGPDDFAARVGGEEFVIVLCGKSVSDAYAFTEQLRKTIQAIRFEDISLVRSITCSFGIAQFQGHEDFWRAVDRADKILYAAKKAGRNQTLAEGMQTPGVA